MKDDDQPSSFILPKPARTSPAGTTTPHVCAPTLPALETREANRAARGLVALRVRAGRTVLYSSQRTPRPWSAAAGLLHPFLEYDRPPPWLRELVDPMDDQRNVHVSRRPGLGLDIDFDSIREHTL
jgi:hypothetical protein